MTDVSDPPQVRTRRRLSSVWIVPLVALGLAGWLLWKNQADLGPLVRVNFETAEGLSSGKTEVRCRSVKVGMVETVRLASDLHGVVTEVRLEPEYEELLRKDSLFWVVRPRVSTNTVSGLGTLITGAYIELDPAEDGPLASSFRGLEKPPVTPNSIPGLRLTLLAEDASSLSAGSPIYHRGFEVGQVEYARLEPDSRRVSFDIFIKEKYAPLVHTGTRFWNSSGIQIDAGTDGFTFRTPTVQALVAGGASFSTPPSLRSTPLAKNGSTFKLYADEKAAINSTFEPDRRFLLLFDQSVRGLKPQAPVEFRGIPLGRVVDISLADGEAGDRRIPVVIELDSAALGRAAALPDEREKALEDAIEAGLRARLATASLITGSLFIDLDIFPDAEPVEMIEQSGYSVIPTAGSGLAQLESKVNAILTKVEQLPIEGLIASLERAAGETAETLASSRRTLAEVEKVVGEFRSLIDQDSIQALPEQVTQTLADLRDSIDSIGPEGRVQGDLRRTLDELRSALRSVERLSETLTEEPNSLLFGRGSGPDPVPKARR